MGVLRLIFQARQRRQHRPSIQRRMSPSLIFIPIRDRTRQLTPPSTAISSAGSVGRSLAETIYDGAINGAIGQAGAPSRAARKSMLAVSSAVRRYSMRPARKNRCACAISWSATGSIKSPTTVPPAVRAGRKPVRSWKVSRWCAERSNPTEHRPPSGTLDRRNVRRVVTAFPIPPSLPATRSPSSCRAC